MKSLISFIWILILEYRWQFFILSLFVILFTFWGEYLITNSFLNEVFEKDDMLLYFFIFTFTNNYLSNSTMKYIIITPSKMRIYIFQLIEANRYAFVLLIVAFFANLVYYQSFQKVHLMLLFFLIFSVSMTAVQQLSKSVRLSMTNENFKTRAIKQFKIVGSIVITFFAVLFGGMYLLDSVLHIEKIYAQIFFISFGIVMTFWVQIQAYRYFFRRNKHEYSEAEKYEDVVGSFVAKKINKSR